MPTWAPRLAQPPSGQTECITCEVRRTVGNCKRAAAGSEQQCRHSSDPIVKERGAPSMVSYLHVDVTHLGSCNRVAIPLRHLGIPLLTGQGVTVGQAQRTRVER